MSRRRRLPVILALIAVAALIGACGSSAPAGTGANDTAISHEKGVKFAACMRANGVSDFPDPDASGTLTLDGIVNGSSLNLNAPAFRQAIGVCKAFEPPGFTGRKRSAQQQEAALKFARCMRENGVPEFPDPTPSGPIIDTSRIPSAAGRGAHSIPGFGAAAAKCTAIYSGELGVQRQ
jgi:hypothetical protein